jgi:hypothetical protein
VARLVLIKTREKSVLAQEKQSSKEHYERKKKMGSLTAMELATDDYGMSLESQISLHLTSNHYTPIPTSMVPVCIDAIDAVNTDGDWDKEITLPEGISWKDSTTAPAHAIIEAHHLEFWLIERELY